MARKKTEEVVEVKAVEEPVVEESVVEEKPKAKRTTKKKVEEPTVDVIVNVTEDAPAVVEESKAEPAKIETYFEKLDKETTESPIIIEDVQAVEEKSKKIKKVKAKKVEEPVSTEDTTSDLPYRATVISSAISVRKGPGLTFHHIRYLNKDMKVTVLEVSGNWGRIGKDMWININYIEKV